MLYPKSNQYRDVYNLNGIWNFKCVEENYEPTAKAQDSSPMAVPASYNDIITDKKQKNHEGKVLFEREISFPVRDDKIYRLRIGATSHKCDVYLNGEKIGSGINGYYPIDLPLENLKEENRLSVVIDNRLTRESLPVGEIVNGRQITNHDFYNFTGIHRDVLIYSLPKKHIRDIVIQTVVDGDYSLINVSVDTACEKVACRVKDGDGNIVAEGGVGLIKINSPHTWSPESPYLYTLIVETECDKYEETFGIRKVEVKGNQFLLNDKPVYFKGFGMHEDFFISGKGANNAVNVRNFELLKWINANSFRTSHYPYSEDIMDLADKYGFMVIDEVPAVGMNRFGGPLKIFSGDRALVDESTKVLHKECIKQLIERDKNHPSVVMLCVGNEPAVEEEECYEYFKDIFAYTRSLCDLPLTMVHCGFSPSEKNSGILPDVICLNRYYAWYYVHHGETEEIHDILKGELEAFYNRYHKPIMLTEYGADTIEGLHTLPSESFSEEYQVETIDEYSKVFDELEYFIGEHVWAFADFKTKQGLTRIRGNRKGVFTKERQPKMIAHYLKNRWKDKQ